VSPATIAAALLPTRAQRNFVFTSSRTGEDPALTLRSETHGPKLDCLPSETEARCAAAPLLVRRHIEVASGYDCRVTSDKVAKRD